MAMDIFEQKLMEDNKGMCESQKAFLAAWKEILISYSQRTIRAKDQTHNLGVRVSELQTVRKTMYKPLKLHSYSNQNSKSKPVSHYGWDDKD